MKRIIITLIVLAIASLCAIVAYAQTPVYPKISAGISTFYLDHTYFTWKSTGTVNAETLAISPGAVLNRYTRGFQAPSGYVTISGKAILTAGTDSFKVIVLGNIRQDGSTTLTLLDTTALTRLDSTKVLAAGYYNYAFNLAGKFQPWLYLEFVGLNKAAAVTGKSLNTIIGVE